MAQRQLKREESLFEPEVHNPFVHPLKLSTLDKFQIAIMSVTLVPIRLLGLSLSLVIAWIFASIALFGRTKEDEKKPMSGWRRALEWPVRLAGRLIMFFAGFHHLRVKGKRSSSAEAPVLVCAPHSSFLDVVIILATEHLPSAVNRIENSQLPVFGTLTKFTQPVFVSREDPNSRQNTIKEIRQRAQTGGAWPQIIIFPEGTCTNRKCLITFKPGAFYPGVPVQPVCIRYPNKLDTFTWTWEGPTAFRVFWYTMCQFHNKMEIEFLPVYNPSEEEKNDPKLFSQNVRAVMAKALGVPVTDHTYEDCRLMKFAAKLDMPAAAGLVEFNKIGKKLGLTLEVVKTNLEKFREMAQDGEHGVVNLEQFASYLDLPVSPLLKDLFDLIDRDGSGTIDFREYVIGLHLITEPANNEETIQFAFQLFDVGNKGHITQEELADMLQKAFGMHDVDCQGLFSKVDTDNDGHISYDEFKSYAEQKPEYAKLFASYQESTVFDRIDAKLLSNGLPWCNHDDTNGDIMDDSSKQKAE